VLAQGVSLSLFSIGRKPATESKRSEDEVHGLWKTVEDFSERTNYISKTDRA